MCSGNTFRHSKTSWMFGTRVRWDSVAIQEVQTPPSTPSSLQVLHAMRRGRHIVVLGSPLSDMSSVAVLIHKRWMRCLGDITDKPHVVSVVLHARRQAGLLCQIQFVSANIPSEAGVSITRSVSTSRPQVRRCRNSSTSRVKGQTSAKSADTSNICEIATPGVVICIPSSIGFRCRFDSDDNGGAHTGHAEGRYRSYASVELVTCAGVEAQSDAGDMISCADPRIGVYVEE